MPLLILLNAILLYVVRPLKPLLPTALRPRPRKVRRPRLQTVKRGVTPTLASPPSREVMGPFLIVLALCLLGLSIYSRTPLKAYPSVEGRKYALYGVMSCEG